MEVIIKIPDLDWSKVKNGSTATANLLNAVRNGIPLPKGHGRLKDVDMLESHDEHDGQGFTQSVYKDDIDSLPTIIEADGGEH